MGEKEREREREREKEREREGKRGKEREREIEYLMIQCLSGSSMDQIIIAQSRPPLATYIELGAQATQFT